MRATYEILQNLLKCNKGMKLVFRENSNILDIYLYNDIVLTLELNDDSIENNSDIIYNSITLQKMHFDKQFELAKKLGVKTRRKVCTIYSLKDLKKMARTIALDSSYIIEKPKGKMLRLISES
jgi:hypothetical protein